MNENKNDRKMAMKISLEIYLFFTFKANKFEKKRLKNVGMENQLKNQTTFPLLHFTLAFPVCTEFSK